MRTFASGGWLLGDARLDVRLVYSAFLVLVTVGLLTVAAFQLKHVGPTPDRIAAYYRGGMRGAEIAFPKTFRELVELTHFHAFVMALVYLVLAHLLVATTAPDGVKRALIVLAFVGIAGDIVGVWLIRYVAGGFAYMQVACWVFEWVGFAGFVYYPLQEMWFRRGRAESLPPE